MAFQDALVKLMSDGLPLWQLFFLRSVLTLPLLALMAGSARGAVFRKALGAWVLIRSALIVAMYVFFYAALPLLDLSLISAVYYTGPLFIVLFAALLLGERIGAAQIMAILLAFLGVLIVLQPWGGDMSWAALVPLVSAVCYALAAVVTRGRIQTVEPLAMVIGLNIVFVFVGAAGMTGTAALARPELYPFLTTPWSGLGLHNLAVVLILALISVGIHFGLARAYQLGPMAVVAGLDFSYLVFAALWSLLFFGTVPGITLIAGTLMIGAAGLYGVVRPQVAR